MTQKLEFDRISFGKILAYGGLLILVLFTIGIYLVFIPAYFQVQTKFTFEYYNQSLIGLNPAVYGVFTVLRDMLSTLSFWLVAAVLAWRNWRNPYVAFLTAVLVLAGVTFPNILLVEVDNLILVYAARSIRYLSYIFFILFIYLFPDGKFYPRWLRIPAISWPVILFLPIFGAELFPDRFPAVLMRDIQAGLLIVYALTGILSQVFKYRNYSEVVEKQQTKWVIFGFALVLTGSIIINLGFVILRQLLPEITAFLIYDLGLITVFGFPTAILFPILIGVSVMRYRLWDLQTILSRTMIYFFVTVVLFLIAFFIVFITQLLTIKITGRSSGIEVIISILLIVVFAGPIYTYSRTKITEWIYPKEIEYNLEIEQFTNEARVLFDEKAITRRLEASIAAVVDLQFSRVFLLESTDELNLVAPLDPDNSHPLRTMEMLYNAIHTQGPYFPGSETEGFFIALINEQLPLENQVMGVLEIGSKKTGKGYSRDELIFFESIASEAALALYVSHVQTQITLLAAALESAVNGIALVNAGGNILWVNPAFNHLTGYSSDEMVGKRFTLLSDVLRRKKQTAWETVSNKNAWTGSGESARKDGSYYYEELTMTPVQGDDGRISHLVVIKNDITSRIEIQNKLEHLATHDALTNLPNRILFHDRLQQALIQADRFGSFGAVLYLDLDDFKAVNDVYTHELGDALLIKLAERMQAAVRANDTIARIGGDEFALLMVEIDKPVDAGLFGKRIIQLIESPIKIDGINLQIAGSIGVSIYPQDGIQSSELMRKADIAMYRAKNSGKGRVAYFTEAMSREVEENLTIRNLLRTAVDEHRLLIHFQPQITMRTNRLRGLEALLRLEHPKEGLLKPARFLDLAEKSGLIIELDDWVLNEAIDIGKLVNGWVGHPVKMAVNISPRQLFSNGFLGKLEDALARHNYPAECLEIELTENSMIQNLNEARKLLYQIKELGVGLALDDFGKGYSSLNYLAMLPFDVLKIDRNFTTNLETSLEHIAVFNGILTIAGDLGISVIAEGIETHAQLENLINKGIKLGQGYYFRKPIPHTELFTYISDVKRKHLAHSHR